MPAGNRPSSKVRLTAFFFNTEGCLLEGGRSNVFVRFGSEWHTPPLSLDILNGVMRLRRAGRFATLFKHRAHFRAPHHAGAIAAGG